MGPWRGEMSIRLFLNIDYLVKLITSGRYTKNRWSISNEWSWLFSFLIHPLDLLNWSLCICHIAGPWHWEIPGRQPAKNLSAARTAATSPSPNGSCDTEPPRTWPVQRALGPELLDEQGCLRFWRLKWRLFQQNLGGPWMYPTLPTPLVTIFFPEII